MALGFCAASHLDQCLLKLEEITKTDMIRKSSGFMGFIKVSSMGKFTQLYDINVSILLVKVFLT